MALVKILFEPKFFYENGDEFQNFVQVDEIMKTLIISKIDNTA